LSEAESALKAAKAIEERMSQEVERYRNDLHNGTHNGISFVGAILSSFPIFGGISKACKAAAEEQKRV
jgi:hypothetical protein